MDTLDKLYVEDKRHINLWKKHYTNGEFYKINKRLRRRLEILIKKRRNLSPREYFICAAIYHHGFTLTSSKKALYYVKRAQKLGYRKQKWLIASIIDRLLQMQGNPQKYGTQITLLKNGEFKRLKNGKYVLYKMDGSISDEERISLGLPKLKKLKKYLEG